jgi:DmsE family decaheme c-type cytochrome
MQIASMRTAALLAVVFLLSGGSAGGATAADQAAGEAAKPAAAEEAPAEPAYSRKGADTCLNCHEDPEVLGLFRTPHGAPQDARSPFGHGQLQCEACHGPGGAHTGRVKRGEKRPPVVRFGKGTETPVEQQNGMCLGCHQDTASHWQAGPHDASEVGCADCHSSHLPSDPVLKTSTQSEVCGTCHQTQKSQQLLPYTHPLYAGKMACSSCHALHGTNSTSQLAGNNLTETCTSCHADLRGPFLWEHQPVAEDCSNCHAPHGSTQPAMLKARGPFLCQQCHQASGHPSVALGSDNLPGRGVPDAMVVGGNCMNCHSQVHGSNHPSGSKLMR